MTHPIDDSRRAFLRRSGVGMAALMMPGLAQAAAPGAARGAKSVIVLLLEGGMSHLETWDPKPNAPKEIRGIFGQIKTTNPDLVIGEHLPRLARQAHLYNVVRSVHSAARNHSPGLHWVLTGYNNPAASVNGQKKNTHPSMGSIVAHQLGGGTPDGLPSFVAAPRSDQLGGRVNYTGALHLGARCDALNSGALPASAKGRYQIPAGIVIPSHLGLDRLKSRRSLLDKLSDLGRELDATAQELGEFQQKAFSLLLGQRGRAAFDINREPAKVRQAYGDSAMGQGALLARRLVEAGVNYVLVNFSKNNSFDTHRDNFNRLKKTLLPPLDQAVAALLEDLQQRGLLDDTVVLMMGEMGRTPIINKNAGRDHWPDVYSVLIAGGGLASGRVIGSSTAGGERPSRRPVHVGELLATVYAQLGIRPDLKLPDEFGRPIYILPDDPQPVAELL